MTQTPSATKRRIDFLDYLRIFAFVSVLMGHKFYLQVDALASDTTKHVTIRTLAEILRALCFGGAAGVVVFFLISGYVITHVLRSESAPEFLIKRLFRIYPLYWLAILMQAVMDAALTPNTPFPPIDVMLPRLLLVGDFFRTPCALEGVEWTLRIEVLFYLFMAALKAFGAFRGGRRLPVAFLLVALALHAFPPFPSNWTWSVGYVTLYAPFLFVGSLLYLAQHRPAGRALCLSVAGVLVFAFLLSIPAIQPNWKESNYAALALLLFIAAQALHSRLAAGRVVRVVSGLTYSVYLFHNWLWSYIEMAVTRVGIPLVPVELQIMLVLFAFCYLVHVSVERYGIRLGRRACGRLLRSRPVEETAPVPPEDVTTVAAGR